MSIILALFLGLIQGLTEFLPVSSSGHLMLAEHLLNMPRNMLLFNIILHLATLIAVVIVFHKKIWQLIRHPFNKTNLALLIATAITCTMVLLFKDLIDRTFTPRILPLAFFTTAVILLSTKLLTHKEKHCEFPSDAEGWRRRAVTGCVAGLAQGIAVIPGLSRSGLTISAGLLAGTKREEAAEFSFLMSIPIIIASFVYELLGSHGSLKIEVLPTAFSFIAALLAGIFAIKLMLQLVQKIKLHWFSLYLLVLAIVTFFII